MMQLPGIMSPSQAKSINFLIVYKYNNLKLKYLMIFIHHLLKQIKNENLKSQKLIYLLEWILRNKNEMRLNDEVQKEYDMLFNSNNCIIILMSNTLLNSSLGLRDSLHKSDSKLNIAEHSPMEETDDAQDQKCVVCSQNNKKRGRFFSACQHNGSCIKCAERHMISCIEENKFPTCMIEGNCNAKMIISQISLYQYFTQKGLDKWRQFLRNQGAPRYPPCKVPNCRGVIDRLRCLRCDQQYCQNCENFSHSIYQRCQRPLQTLIEGIKNCPNCNTSYIRDSGCQHITCVTCAYEFCEACKGPWNVFHHGCFNERLSRQSLQSRRQTISPTPKPKRSGCFGQLCAIF